MVLVGIRLSAILRRRKKASGFRGGAVAAASTKANGAVVFGLVPKAAHMRAGHHQGKRNSNSGSNGNGNCSD